MSILRAENISKTFDENNIKVDILKNINAEFKEGKFTTIMGPSGSGKSTFLYILGGLIKPTSGNVILNGKSINDLSDKDLSKIRRMDIGFIFQFYNLIPTLSIEENIAMPVLLNKEPIKKYKKKIDKLIDMVGLNHRKRHKPSQLSGGEQQRVALARALINDPKVILADEPTGNLDSKTSEEILNLLRNLSSKHGKTLVMVTHDPNVAQYADNRITIKDGSIYNFT
ncbi:ABC transporter ATP-binding protein (plasmid) [Haloimpatiens sp. FM7330]|uniref:ABC transporter ATP-binding protein n=1 Tax=Haloimpatiens sp. FM7330 TaxID=3298610 RepID=UPI00362D44A6